MKLQGVLLTPILVMIRSNALSLCVHNDYPRIICMNEKSFASLAFCLRQIFDTFLDLLES